MTKRAIVTMETLDITVYCEPFQQNKAVYADRWGYEYFRHQKLHHRWAKIHPVYSKILYAQELLSNGYDPVVLVDADIAFTDYTRDVGKLLRRQDWIAGMREVGKPHSKYICIGLTVFRNCREARSTLQHIEHLVDGGDHPNEVGQQEQRMLNDYLQARDYKGIRACTEDEIGSVWPEVGNPPLLRSWQPGDLHIHCSLTAWPYRGGQYLAKYAAQVKYK